MMNKDAELLSAIYKNAKTGYHSTDALLPKASQGKFGGELRSCRDQYQNFAKDASQRLQEMELSPKEPNPLSKLSMQVGIAANTMLDSSPPGRNDDQRQHHGHHRPGKTAETMWGIRPRGAATGQRPIGI